MRLLITVKFNTEKWEIRLSGKEKKGSRNGKCDFTTREVIKLGNIH